MTKHRKISTFMALVCAGAGAITCAQSTPKLTTLYSFSGGDDGNAPISSVTIAPGGVLYGTTLYGGTMQSGVAYALQPPAAAGRAWTEQVLYNFNGATGDLPDGVLLLGGNGVLYGGAGGLTPGDDPSHGLGTINNGALYSLTPPSTANPSWQYTELIGFGQGYGPGILLNGGGVLYASVLGPNSLISMAPPASPGGSWTATALYTFTFSTGTAAVFARDSSGVFYGLAYSQSGDEIFSLTPPAAAGGTWTLTNLGSPDFPATGLTLSPRGVLYGTTSAGGGSTACPPAVGCGSVFAVVPPASAGGVATIKDIYSFNSSDGSLPGGNFVVRGGVLYGTTETGGAFNYGTVYALHPPASPGGSWTETVLYSFTNGRDGAIPLALTVGPNGVLYGVTGGDGRKTHGSVFELRY